MFKKKITYVMICLISVPSKFSQLPPPLQRVSMLFIQVEMDQYRISDPVCVARMSIFCLYLYPYRRRLLQGLGVLITKKRLHSKSVITDHLESEKIKINKLVIYSIYLIEKGSLILMILFLFRKDMFPICTATTTPEVSSLGFCSL